MTKIITEESFNKFLKSAKEIFPHCPNVADMQNVKWPEVLEVELVAKEIIADKSNA